MECLDGSVLFLDCELHVDAVHLIENLSSDLVVLGLVGIGLDLVELLQVPPHAEQASLGQGLLLLLQLPLVTGPSGLRTGVNGFLPGCVRVLRNVIFKFIYVLRCHLLETTWWILSANVILLIRVLNMSLLSLLQEFLGPN